jgi:putative redox protein
MDAKVIWSKGMSFTGTANTGFEVPLDSDASVGGANGGFRPLELMAVSLAGCTAMDVISILRKKQQDVIDFEVRVHADQQDDHPHVFTQAVITYLITGRDVAESALTRAIELSATKYCPVQAMLTEVFPISMEYEIFENEGGTKVMKKKGIWTPKE